MKIIQNLFPILLGIVFFLPLLNMIQGVDNIPVLNGIALYSVDIAFGGVVVFAFVLFYGYRYTFIYQFKGYASVLSYMNNDEKAITMFLEDLKTATKELIIYADGHDSITNIYNNVEVIEVLKKKLEEYENFKITCFFNLENIKESKFYKTFSDSNYEKRVTIKIRQNTEEAKKQKLDKNKHFKIFDSKIIVFNEHKGKERHCLKLAEYTGKGVPKIIKENKKIIDTIMSSEEQVA